MSQYNTPTIYTDGSCHTQIKIGAWVAIVFVNGNKTVLSGVDINTTHNQMELKAAIKAIEYIIDFYPAFKGASIYTDSQYVAMLPMRHEKLSAAGLTNCSGAEMTNAPLVASFFECLKKLAVRFVKVKAHQKQNDIVNPNIEADKLSRKLVRAAVEKISLRQ